VKSRNAQELLNEAGYLRRSKLNNSNNNNNNHSWDARTYNKVSSNVQLEWGRKLLDKRKWTGNEIVMDAGAGSGNLTKILAEKVPNGKVFAVDADPNMIHQAKSNLSDYKNVQVIHSSMDKVYLPTEVDVIFSNAALHWILDQEALFSHFWQLLKPNGELLMEGGGGKNLEMTIPVIFKIMQSDQFKEHFVNWKQSWYFPRREETERLLQNVRFKDIQVNLSKKSTSFSDRESFAIFVKTVIMKPFLGYIPDSKKKDEFLDAFLDELERSGQSWSLDFMLLSIFARR
jgi:trans-aconitate 2-methyltransferase